MRTRTFIGLIFLVIALVIVSTPALLTPASRGAEALLTKASAPGFEATVAAKEDSNTTPADGAEAVEPVFIIKGRLATQDEDLRDKFSPGERGANASHRLASGRTRAGLPGQLATTEEPLEYENAVLLDNEGCPVFRSGTDVVELWRDEELRALYEQRAAAADDPDECAGVMRARRIEAITAPDASRVDTRDLSRAVRGGSNALAMSSTMWDYWDAMFGDSSDWAESAQDGRSVLNG